MATCRSKNRQTISDAADYKVLNSVRNGHVSLKAQQQPTTSLFVVAVLAAFGAAMLLPGCSGGEDLPDLSMEEAKKNNISPPQTTTPLLEIEKSSVPVVGGFSETEKREKINVTTDVLDIVIDTAGGTVEYVALNKYPVSKKNPDEKIVLLQQNEQDGFYLMQGGFKQNQQHYP